MDEVLARSGIFQGVDPEAAEALAKEMDTVEVRKGDVLFNEGEAGDSLYIVLSGKIKLGRRAADGRQNLVSIMGPSDMVGTARRSPSSSCGCWPGGCGGPTTPWPT
jgi:CRP/FNR family transcriptional regulator, cyclic AMP receptor protein